MKKIIALALVLIMACCLFASCSKKLSGTYTADAAVVKGSYKFSGSKFTHTTSALIGGSLVEEGTYEITSNDNGMEITFTVKNDDGKTASSTFMFTEDKDTGVITIAGIPYKKQ